MSAEEQMHREASDWPSEDEAFVQALIGIRDREMRGFSAPRSSFDPDSSSAVYRFASTSVSLAGVIELILEVTNPRHQPAYEKVAWIREFDFRGKTCRLQWGKSGLWLTLLTPGGGDGDVAGLGREVERRLTSAAISLYERAIYPRVQRELRENRASVVNQFVRYRAAVDYHLAQLRQKREYGAAKSRPEPIETFDSAFVSVFQGVMADATHQRELAYICTAVIATYFAYVQHSLIVLSAFSPKALCSEFSLQRLLDAGWAEQFDVAYPTPHQGRVSRAKQALSHLAKNYRGRLLHGGGGHPADGLFVEWAPGRHTLVTEDGKPSAQFMLWQAALSAEEIEDVLERINQVDETLESHPYYPWLSSGLEADFRPPAIEYALRMVVEGRVREYIRYSNDSFDKAVNWD